MSHPLTATAEAKTADDITRANAADETASALQEMADETRAIALRFNDPAFDTVNHLASMLEQGAAEFTSLAETFRAYAGAA